MVLWFALYETIIWSFEGLAAINVTSASGTTTTTLRYATVIQ